MKKIYPLLLLALLSVSSITAQITIDQNDFANSGDTVRMSNAVWNPFLDFGATGANYTWDFSSLEWQSQYVDSFLNPILINPIYSLVFSNLPINPYRSNVAHREDNVLTTIPILSSVFTEPFNFFYKTSDLYRQRGIGMKVSGFPTVVPMTHSDTLYRFPIHYGNEDSSWSDYKVNVPQLGLYKHKQHRVNKVDGWGTLITPFGTFDALRVRTEIRGSDSLYIDTLDFGFRYDNDIKREYKWFGKKQKEPLLQIFTQAGILGQFQGFEFVTKIVYRDSVRFLPVGIFDVNSNELSLNVFPNPSSDMFYISLPDGLNNAILTLTDINGKLLISREVITAVDRIDAAELSKGVYILTLQSKEGKAQRKLVVQ